MEHNRAESQGARQDRVTVDESGRPLLDLIEGVVVRPALNVCDERGELTELYDPAWGFTSEPLVYAYQVVATPGSIRGWVLHERQDDRLFFSLGRLRVVLYDDRDGSPTRGRINELYFGERNRALLRIPRQVFHAVQNIGVSDALFVNFPTTPYDRSNPDKFRLPLDSDRIPYKFPVIGPHRAAAAT